MIEKSLIFRLVNKAEDIGDVIIKGTEFKLTMPSLENQGKEPIDGSCGSPLKLR